MLQAPLWMQNAMSAIILAPTDLSGMPDLCPDIFVESDKDGQWYVVGTSDDQKVPRHNGQPSKTHAINLGIQFFWSEPF
jgi:hypothetical protein